MLLFFHVESARSISHRSDTLTFTTHISDYKNHRVFDNTVLKRFCYILSILDSSWFSPVSIESMGESFAAAKVAHSIFNRKTHMGLKGGEHPRFQ